MNLPQAACNYAVLRFLPYPETGEFVNVGVVVNCLDPVLFDFCLEPQMTPRMKALFPDQDEQAFAAGIVAMQKELMRVKDMIRDARTCQNAFQEVVRPRESTFRFGETGTLLTKDTEYIEEELFRLYVRMEGRPKNKAQLVTT